MRSAAIPSRPLPRDRRESCRCLSVEFLVCGEFFPWSQGTLFFRKSGSVSIFRGEQGSDASGGAVAGNPDQHHEPGLTLDERGDLGFVSLA
jgi:hypothetical protein